MYSPSSLMQGGQVSEAGVGKSAVVHSTAQTMNDDRKHRGQVVHETLQQPIFSHHVNDPQSECVPETIR